MSEMIPAQAVGAAEEAAHEAFVMWKWSELDHHESREFFTAILEAAAPYMQQEVDLMRWKLNALSKWADAMIDESYYPQYGRDVKTILDVSSIEETKEDFGDD